MSEHIHDCTGPDMTCPCGYKLHIAPICVSFEVTRFNQASRDTDVLVSDGFNCNDVEMAARALEQAARRLRGMER